MKITKASNGKVRITLSKKEWEEMGKTAGWRGEWPHGSTYTKDNEAKINTWKEILVKSPEEYLNVPNYLKLNKEILQVLPTDMISKIKSQLEKTIPKEKIEELIGA